MAAEQEGEAPDETAAWEALCRRCGICCHQKVRFGEIVVITDVPCEFLDTETNTCTVYPERFIRQPLCSSAETSVELGTLPECCPYVGGRDGYRAPVMLADHPEYEQAVNTLFPERVGGQPSQSRIKAKRRRRR